MKISSPKQKNKQKNKQKINRISTETNKRTRKGRNRLATEDKPDMQFWECLGTGLQTSKHCVPVPSKSRPFAGGQDATYRRVDVSLEVRAQLHAGGVQQKTVPTDHGRGPPFRGNRNTVPVRRRVGEGNERTNDQTKVQQRSVEI